MVTSGQKIVTYLSYQKLDKVLLGKITLRNVQLKEGTLIAARKGLICPVELCEVGFKTADEVQASSGSSNKNGHS